MFTSTKLLQEIWIVLHLRAIFSKRPQCLAQSFIVFYSFLPYYDNTGKPSSFSLQVWQHRWLITTIDSPNLIMVSQVPRGSHHLTQRSRKHVAKYIDVIGSIIVGQRCNTLWSMVYLQPSHVVRKLFYQLLLKSIYNYCLPNRITKGEFTLFYIMVIGTLLLAVHRLVLFPQM